MDTEALKTILDLQHNVSMYKRMFADILLLLSATDNQDIPDYNYSVSSDIQSSMMIIMGNIRKLKARISELEQS